MEILKTPEHIETVFAHYFEINGINNGVVGVRMTAIREEDAPAGEEYWWEVPLTAFDEQDLDRVFDGATGEVHRFNVTYVDGEHEEVTMFSPYPLPDPTRIDPGKSRAWAQEVMKGYVPLPVE